VRWTFAAHHETPMRARHAAIRWALGHTDDAGTLADIALAITEATTNAVLHAYRGWERPGTIVVEVARREQQLWFYVRDAGGGLQPRLDSPGLGLGLGLIAQVCDQSDVRSGASGGTEVAMRFDITRRDAARAS